MGRAVRKTSPAMVKLAAFAKDANDYEVRIGWFASAKYPNGTPVAYVASIHIFGAPSRGIPARDFLHPVLNSQQGEWSQQMRYSAHQIVNGEIDTRGALERLALTAGGDVAASLARIKEPPLSPLTVYIRKYIKNGGTVDSYTKVMELRDAMEREKQAGTLDLSGVSDDPLEFTGYMRATLSYSVVYKGSEGAAIPVRGR